ncbi:MAG: ribonuclease III [Planctomycetes bacterium]|nr:ribonuclease III [Planctomycetota bacterium]
MNNDSLAACQRVIEYHFHDLTLLERALTHSSMKTSDMESNERLEFLGDSVLAMVIAQRIFEKYPHHAEGEMTKIKSVVVSRRMLAKVGKELSLYCYMTIGKGITTCRKIPQSVHGNVLEALIGAMYLDGGLAPAREFILRHLDDLIDLVEKDRHGANFKSLLQQHSQRHMNTTPSYRVINEHGPDHGKSFEVMAIIGGKEYGSGWGNNKKDAEQRAAQKTLEMLRHKSVIAEAEKARGSVEEA